MDKLFIFDLDGVLVDACDWHYEALNLALKDICGYEISREEHMETFNGIPTLRKLSILKDRGILNKSQMDKVSPLKQKYTIQTIDELCKVDPTKVSLLRSLKERRFKTACVTNSIRLNSILLF